MGKMKSRTWKKNSSLTLDDCFYFINGIPNDWQSITIDLHAPKSLITKGEVSPGVIIRIDGPQLGETINSCSIKYCPHLPKPPSINHTGLCYFHKDTKWEKESIDKMLAHHKIPCGIFLSDVGRSTYKADIKDKKELLKHFVNIGYSIGTLDVVRGSYKVLIGRKRAEYPNFEKTESFFLNNRDGEKGLPFALIRWDSDMGSYENLRGFVKLIKSRGFVKEKE